MRDEPKEDHMAAMRSAGFRQLPPHARARELETEYVIELDVADFAESELHVEATGPIVTIRGDQPESGEDALTAFCMHERLEESFRLPNDADLDGIAVAYCHGVLKLRVPRVALVKRRLTLHRRTISALNPDAEGV
jgi:HSP20 family molecular chaperone IbpA